MADRQAHKVLPGSVEVTTTAAVLKQLHSAKCGFTCGKKTNNISTLWSHSGICQDDEMRTLISKSANPALILKVSVVLTQ